MDLNPLFGDVNIFKLLTMATLLSFIRIAETVVEVGTNLDCPDTIHQQYVLPGALLPVGTPDRARLTLPSAFTLAASHIPEAGLGVISNTFIHKYTWLGEMEGEYVTTEDFDERGTDYAWIINSSEDEELDYEEVLMYSDARDPEASNWIRYVNCARHSLEENVMCLQCYGRRFLITVRDIPPGRELLVYYGRDYAMWLGVEDDFFYNRPFWLTGKRSSSPQEK